MCRMINSDTKWWVLFFLIRRQFRWFWSNHNIQGWKLSFCCKCQISRLQSATNQLPRTQINDIWHRSSPIPIPVTRLLPRLTAYKAHELWEGISMQKPLLLTHSSSYVYCNWRVHCIHAGICLCMPFRKLPPCTLSAVVLMPAELIEQCRTWHFHCSRPQRLMVAKPR